MSTQADNVRQECVREHEWNDMAWVDEEKWPYSKLNIPQKIFTILFSILRVAILFCLLYIFIISLGLLSSGFVILGGTTTGLTFRNSDFFNHSIASCVVGIIATVLVQSSAASTSIIISMTAANLLKVNQSVYMIMGANIGTTKTSILVALGHAHDKNQFRRAFGGASIHHIFNCFSAMILLPLELATGLLQLMSESTVKTLNIPEGYEAPNFVKLVTTPVTSRIISVDKKLMAQIGKESNQTILDGLVKKSMVKWSDCAQTRFVYCPVQNHFSDAAVGITLTLGAVMLLTLGLVLLVKLLRSSLKGATAKYIYKAVNFEMRSPFTWLSDYLLAIFAIGVTILVQSSSVTTSSLTPLVGIGLLKLEKMYPLTIGANIGTTTTGILAAMGSSQLYIALTVAFCHLYFNTMGACLWFLFPYMRTLPLSLVKKLGNKAAEYRWFAPFYLVVAYIIIPLILLGLSLAGTMVFEAIMGPIIFLFIAYLILRTVRQKKPEVLPNWLKEFYWLPKWMREEPLCLRACSRKVITRAESISRANTESQLRRDSGEILTTLDKIYMALDFSAKNKIEDSENEEKEEINKDQVQIQMSENICKIHPTRNT